MANGNAAMEKQARGERFVAKVFEATIWELGRVGFERLSIEEIASRAGVNKTSIYRRWATIELLVVEALTHTTRNVVEVPDTGHLRSDLVAYLLRFLRVRSSPLKLNIARMNFGQGFGGRVGAFLKRLEEDSAQQRCSRLQRAIDRGELPPRADVEVAQELIQGVVFGLVGSRSYTGSDARLRRVVDAILAGVGALAARGERSGASSVRRRPPR
jgi:AcrR family transcriptional regulator